ncbi:hypothetical protein D1872_254550 [compost metagenome]
MPGEVAIVKHMVVPMLSAPQNRFIRLIAKFAEKTGAFQNLADSDDTPHSQIFVNMMVQGPPDHFKLVDLVHAGLGVFRFAPLYNDGDLQFIRVKRQCVPFPVQQLLDDVQRGVLQQPDIPLPI